MNAEIGSVLKGWIFLVAWLGFGWSQDSGWLMAAPATASERVLLEWTFDQDGDLLGWQPNAHLAGVTVSNGVLACRAVGADPILELKPRLDLKATPWQVLELRLKADRNGTAEIFWSDTDQGRFGGFTQEKTTRFEVAGDGEWHSYRLMPFWQMEQKVVRLRFDVYDGTRFEVDSIRILELAMPPAAERADFDFEKGSQGWREAENAGQHFQLSPPVRIDTAQNSFVSVRMAVGAGVAPVQEPSRATLVYATDAKPGLHSFTFLVQADGREHTYNLDLLDASDWRGHILALGLRWPGAGTATDLPRWLKVSDTPQGPPQLTIRSFAVEAALPRVGRPIQLKAVIANTGAEVATNIQASLEFAGKTAVSPTNLPINSLGFDEERTLRWTIQSDSPGARPVVLKVAAPNADAVQTEARVSFTPRPAVPRATYVPEPQVARGPYEVGAYYFPGWKTMSQWNPIQGFPERRPVLGWYREGNPEVADWHIKWAVEHGITFFAYDWYWSQGSRQLEHALHDGYFKARYRHLLKFCLLWANHNAPKTSSQDDCLAVTRYWIENYFRRPEHLTVEGKPVMIIFSPHRLSEDLGSDGVKKAFEAMRTECVRAGLKGLYLIACVGDAGQARQAAAEGYDAVTAYNWPHLGRQDDSMYAPFEGLLEGYRRNWSHILEQSSIPLLPLPVCGGWDSRPWHGENNLVRFGRTPALFRQHLEDAKRFLDSDAYRKLKGGNLVLVEAWNEWGEGSYIEPHQEYGFGYLDAIRAVFTEASRAHVDLTPVDVGLGPYEVEPQPVQTAWRFERGNEGWSNTMGLDEVKTNTGALLARTTSNDPAFFGPPMEARSSEFKSVLVRMKLAHPDGQAFKDSAQLFWRTRRLPESEATSERFQVIGDGQFHDYHVPVARNIRWRGIVTRLRLDPCNQPGIQVALDRIVLEP